MPIKYSFISMHVIQTILKYTIMEVAAILKKKDANYNRLCFFVTERDPSFRTLKFKIHACIHTWMDFRLH